MKSAVVAALACVLAAGVCAEPTPATAADTRDLYRQQPADLATQLADVATRHGLNLIYPQAGVGALPAAGLVGRFELDAALDQLLHPRGLSWRRMRDGSIRIEAAAPRLRLQVGTVAIDADHVGAVTDPLQVQAADTQSAGTPPALLSERTAAGWSISATALRTLPSADLGRWLGRAPNAYGVGSRLSLRGIERDSFAAQTSSVRLHGIPLSSRALDAQLPLPGNLALIDFALGPQPARLGLPGFAGELNLDSALPAPTPGGSLRVAAGGRAERRVDLLQRAELRAAGAAELTLLARERDGSVEHAGATPRARDRVGSLRWLLEPERLPALTLSADLLWIRARPADQRITAPLGLDAFDPSARRDPFAARSLVLDESGVRFGGRWEGERWTLHSHHVLSDSREHVGVAELASSSTDQLSAEQLRSHQLTASRTLGDSPLSVRASLDQSQRDAHFQTTDLLALSALFPASGIFVPSAGSSRRLRTGVEQTIHSVGAQVWLQARWQQLALEAGTGWTRQRRTDRNLVERTVSAGCTLTARDGSVRDCRSELPELTRRSRVQQDDPVWMPALTALYNPGTFGQFGLQWRRGARSGGARPFAGQAVGFRPERSDSYELNWRSPDQRDWAARIAVFHNAWTDRQVQLLDPGQSGFAIVNAGRASAHGGELTLHRQLWADVSVALGVGVLHTRFDRFQLAAADTPLDLAGKQFPGAPGRTLTLGLTRAPEAGLELGALLQAASRAEGDAYNRPAARLPGRAELDLRVGWRTANWSAGLDLLNALDRKALEQVQLSVVGNSARSYQLNAPRQLRLSVEWRW